MGEQTPVYVISVAARLLDVHPQTLRNYERAGFLRPTRTEGRRRVARSRATSPSRRPRTAASSR